MKKDFLPIGSIVMLKDATKPIMIHSYCIFPKGNVLRDGKEVPADKKLFEYGGCPYPDGIVDTNLVCGFNSEDIETVLFKGYLDDKAKEFLEKINSGYDAVKNAYESGELKI